MAGAAASLAPASGRQAGLRYTSDAVAGIRRRRSGRGFVYIGPDGRRIGAAEQIHRLQALAVPPAWTDGWISCDPPRHLQATGPDGPARTHDRYPPACRGLRDGTEVA